MITVSVELLVFVTVRTAAQQQTGSARPTAGRPAAQTVRNQNAGGGGEMYNAGGDAGRVDELTTQVMSRALTYVISNQSVLESPVIHFDDHLFDSLLLSLLRHGQHRLCLQLSQY